MVKKGLAKRALDPDPQKQLEYFREWKKIDEEGICTIPVDDCTRDQTGNKIIRSQCNKYYNKKTNEPCRKGLLYGCRENTGPIKQNEDLNLICKRNRGTDYAEEIRKQNELLENSRSMNSSIGSSQRSSQRSSRRSSRRRSRSSISKRRRSQSRMSRTDRNFLRRNKEAFKKFGIDPDMTYEQAPRLGGTRKKKKNKKKRAKNKTKSSK